MVVRTALPKNRDATTSGVATSETIDTIVALSPNDVAVVDGHQNFRREFEKFFHYYVTAFGRILPISL